MHPRPFAFVLLLALAAQVSAISVSEVFVSGVAASEHAYLRSILPIKAGELFASVGDLERRAAVAESYLEQEGSFANVSIEIEETSDSEAAVYVLLQSAAISGLSIFGSAMTVIPHFPVYATGFGFLVGAYEQFIGLDVPFVRQLRLDILSGHAQTIAGVHAVSAKAGLNYKPLPLLSFYVPVEVDAYPVPVGAWPVDVALKAGAKIDLTFLEAAYMFGGTLEASARKGVMDFDYTSTHAAAVLSFRPFSFLSLSSAASAYALFGTAPPLRTVNETGNKGLRVGLGLGKDHHSSQGEPRDHEPCSLCGVRPGERSVFLFSVK